MTAVKSCPVATVLEGGYRPERISLAAENVVRALAGFASSSGRSSTGEEQTASRARVATNDPPSDKEMLAPELAEWKARSGPGPSPIMDLKDERDPKHVTPLGAAWRPRIPGFCRPEAVLEMCRRVFNNFPPFQGRNVFRENRKVEIDEEFGCLERQLVNLPHINTPTMELPPTDESADEKKKCSLH